MGKKILSFVNEFPKSKRSLYTLIDTFKRNGINVGEVIDLLLEEAIVTK